MTDERGQAKDASMTAGPRVLLIDDNSEMRAVVRDLLTDDGMTVVGEAADGASGLRLAAELRPDVAVVDVRMPGMNGLEVTREIIALVPGIGVVIHSLFSDPFLEERLRSAGASAIVPKGGASGRLSGEVRRVARTAAAA
jgi:DNA-binding NarL/FixJ family response regulator